MKNKLVYELWFRKKIYLFFSFMWFMFMVSPCLYFPWLEIDLYHYNRVNKVFGSAIHGSTVMHKVHFIYHVLVCVHKKKKLQGPLKSCYNLFPVNWWNITQAITGWQNHEYPIPDSTIISFASLARLDSHGVTTARWTECLTPALRL